MPGKLRRACIPANLISDPEVEVGTYTYTAMKPTLLESDTVWCLLPNERDSPCVRSAKTMKTFGSSVSHKMEGRILTTLAGPRSSPKPVSFSCSKAKLVPAGGKMGRTWSLTALKKKICLRTSENKMWVPEALGTMLVIAY